MEATIAHTAIDRKSQIINKATELFSKEGYDKVTIKNLAVACGITEPALYRHFKSKEGIYCAVLDSIEIRLNHKDFFKSLEKECDIDKILNGLATHIINFFSKNIDVYRLLLFSTLMGHNRAKRVYSLIRGTYVRFLMNQLDRLSEKKLIVGMNNELAARCFIGMIFDCALGTTIWRGFQGKDFKPEDVIRNNVPIYARGMRT